MGSLFFRSPRVKNGPHPGRALDQASGTWNNLPSGPAGHGPRVLQKTLKTFVFNELHNKELQGAEQAVLPQVVEGCTFIQKVTVGWVEAVSGCADKD